MNKNALIKKIVNRLTEELEIYFRAAMASRAEATHEQSKAENKYDTRGLEASYLARGQSKQAAEIQGAIAAFEKYGGPTIIVDFGTATTFDVVSAKGEYLGGIISPGLGISADALFSRAARLGRVDIKRPPKVIGTTTVTHIQSGLYYGYIGLVDGILERMIAEMAEDPRTAGAEPKILATGGLARLIAEDSRYISTIDDMLTLDGLRLVFARNQAAQHAPSRARRH